MTSVTTMDVNWIIAICLLDITVLGKLALNSLLKLDLYVYSNIHYFLKFILSIKPLVIKTIHKYNFALSKRV